MHLALNPYYTNTERLSEMTHIIKGVNLIKQFKDITAVNNVNIEIDKGLFYAIMGRSGSGKTTLLSLLGLLDNMTKGDLYINNVKTSSMNEREKAIIRMKELGFVFQDFHLNPMLKAYENVMIPMHINPQYIKVDIKARAMALLDIFGLKDRARHFPAQLSGGEKQRVALARALANDPKCIFADEPTGNLDIHSERTVLNYLKMLTEQGKSVVVVSHNDIILEYADCIFTMNEGHLKEKRYEE